MNWKYTDDTRTVVWRTCENGDIESCIVGREDVQKWVAAGGVIEEPDTADEKPLEN